MNLPLPAHRLGICTALLLGACGPKGIDYTGYDLEAEIRDHEFWPQQASWAGIRASCDGDHGAYVQIWLNYNADDALLAGEDPLPPGSIIVEEIYDIDGTTLLSMVAQRKLDGYDPSHGDWFWGEFQADYEEIQSGNLAACSDCHATARTDYLPYLDAPIAMTPEDCP